MMLHTPFWEKKHLQADWRNMSVCKPYLSPARWWKSFLHPQCSLPWGAFLWRCGSFVPSVPWMPSIHIYPTDPTGGWATHQNFVREKTLGRKDENCRCNCTQQKLQVADLLFPAKSEKLVHCPPSTSDFPHEGQRLWSPTSSWNCSSCSSMCWSEMLSAFWSFCCEFHVDVGAKVSSHQTASHIWRNVMTRVDQINKQLKLTTTLRSDLTYLDIPRYVCFPIELGP